MDRYLGSQKEHESIKQVDSGAVDATLTRLIREDMHGGKKELQGCEGCTDRFLTCMHR